MSWRDLPPVEENVPPRDKASQTLLARMAVCPRSAYLYLKHDGGLASHAMHRGSAMHEFRRRFLLTLIEKGEPSMPWEIGKDIVAEVVADHPEWVIPPDEMDALRLAAFHICDCTVIDPGSIIAVEKLFELPIGGMRIRGRVDWAYTIEGGVAIRDDKSQVYLPTQAEFDAKVQVPLYALLVGEGYPVREEWIGSDDYGTGYVLETAEPPIGERFGMFDLAEEYPRLEPWEEGNAKVLAYRQRWLTRQELVDQRLYVEGLVAKLEHGLETGEWPAVDGSHCATCPAWQECPLPDLLRTAEGSLSSDAIAERVASQYVFEDKAQRDRKKALKAYAQANGGSVKAGSDLVFEFRDQESEVWAPGQSKETLEAAVQRAVSYGEPFDYGEFRRVRRSSRFDKRKLQPGEEE